MHHSDLKELAKSELRGLFTRGLLHKMRRKNFIEKEAISTNDRDMWEQFKSARNQANNAIKLAKKRYFSDNLEASKGNLRNTWNLIKSSNVFEIQVDSRTILSTADNMAEAFNEHVTSIAQVLSPEEVGHGPQGITGPTIG